MRPLRSECARSLGLLKVPQAAVALISAVRDTDPSVRGEVVTALSLLNDVTAADAILSVFDDSSWDVRNRSAKSLEKLGNLVRARARALVGEATGDLRRQAAMFLADAGDASATECLAATLKDPSAERRKEAVKYFPTEIDLPGPPRQLLALSFSHDGNWLAAAGEDGLKILNAKPASEVRDRLARFDGAAAKPYLSSTLPATALSPSRLDMVSIWGRPYRLD